MHVSAVKKIAKIVFSRLFLVGLAIVLQFLWFFYLFFCLSRSFTFLNILLIIVAWILVLHLVNRRMNPYFKLAWTVVILGFPMLGILLYVMFGRSELTKHNRRRLERVNREIRPLLEQNETYQDELVQLDISVANQTRYIRKWAGSPIYKHTRTEYYRCGEEMFPKMMADIRNARHFVFLEYFILDDGYMFSRLIDALEEKAKQGVEVRLVYDDVGCITTLPTGFYKTLKKMNIKCAAFNPFRPILSAVMNNRDHRKILVVDGKVAYTGGLNIADEYINKKERFGYWKDTGVRMEGEAVWSFTCMFLEMWNYIKGSSEDYKAYYIPMAYSEYISDGFVQPYADSPLYRENIAENIYLNIINKAKTYVYIFTPYLIMDHEMLVALCNAAKCGVDVRIVTPGIPDKKIVFFMTQSDYDVLIESGVRIFQYKKGFIHAKNFVCDDKIATVGSVNLDFRSLYLHFECGVFLYDCQAVMDSKRDALQVMRDSEEITLDFCKYRKLPVRMLQSVLKVLSPLL